MLDAKKITNLGKYFYFSKTRIAAVAVAWVADKWLRAEAGGSSSDHFKMKAVFDGTFINNVYWKNGFAPFVSF